VIIQIPRAKIHFNIDLNYVAVETQRKARKTWREGFLSDSVKGLWRTLRTGGFHSSTGFIET